MGPSSPTRGADILDVGGESTRPGAEAVGEAEEIRRVEPVVADLAGARRTVSIDTSKRAVAEAALDAGATIVNDVTALRGDPEMARALRGARSRAGPHAHAGDAAHDAGRPRLRRRRRRRQGLPRRAARGGGRRRRRRGADLARPRDRLRQDRSSTTSSCCAGSASCASSAGRSWSAPRARASSARSTTPTRRSGSAARSPPRSSPSPRAPTRSASTTSPRSPRR